MGEIIIKQLRF